MKILITGGAGFIGSHISQQLLEQGHQVVVYDSLDSYPEKSLPENSDSSQTFIKAPLKDSKKLVESLQGVDAVIHMASFIAVEESVKNPLKYVENNIEGTTYLLTAMRETGVKKIIFSSSATVYGDPKSLPIQEDAPISAANPYGASKVASEALCESFYHTDGFDVIILRYFNPYGPGENHQPESHAIPNFIKAALEDRPIPLYWKGEPVRDFIYVEDLAAAHIAVLSLTGFQVFNVSTGQGTKIIDVVNKLSDILGKEVKIEDKGERSGDVMSTYASNDKLSQATKWKAKTDLEQGLRKTLEWFKDNS